MIYFHKILPLLFSPLFLIISLIILGLILNSKKISLTGIAILIIFSVPIVSNKLMAYLESDYELIKPSKVETADAVVVLSGMVSTIKTKDRLDYDASKRKPGKMGGGKIYASSNKRYANGGKIYPARGKM